MSFNLNAKGGRFRNVIMGNNISVNGSTNSATWRNGNSVVQLNGNQAIVNGVVYTLPAYRSISFANGQIILDGKPWSGMDARKRSMMGTLTPFEKVLTDVDCEKHYRVVGFMTIRVVEGTAFHVRVSGMMYGAEEPAITLDCKKSVLIDTNNCIELCEIELTIPSTCSLETLECMESNVVKIDQFNHPSLTLLCSNVNTLEMTQCSVNSLNSTTANVYLNTVSCQDVTAATQSNNIDISNCIILNSLQATTMSGDVTLSGNIEGGIHVKTMSGDVNLQHFSGKGGVVNTMSGDVNFYQNGAVNALQVCTMSGDLKGSGRTRPVFSSMSGENRFRVKS